MPSLPRHPRTRPKNAPKTTFFGSHFHPFLTLFPKRRPTISSMSVFPRTPLGTGWIVVRFVRHDTQLVKVCMKGSRLGALFAVCLGSVFVVTETVSATPRGGQGAASIEQCRASAEQGDAVAQFNLALCYLSGEGGWSVRPRGPRFGCGKPPARGIVRPRACCERWRPRNRGPRRDRAACLEGCAGRGKAPRLFSLNR